MSLMPLEDDDPMAQLLRGYGGPYAQPNMPPPNVPQQPPMGFGQRLAQGAKGLAGNRDLALALLANSGYGPKQTFGQILGNSMIQADQAKSQRADDEFKRQYMTAQMARMQGGGGDLFGPVNPSQFTPESQAKFAQSHNYGDLVRIPDQREVVDTAPIKNSKYRASLKTPEEQRAFDDYVRQNYEVVENGGVQTVVRKGPNPTTQPLNTLENEVAAKAAIKGGESEATAVGTGKGNIQAGIQTKGANATNVLGMLDEAEKLLPDATGSLGGTAVDAAAGAFGKSTRGAKATARLKVLQAGLMLNMPRMEGPQSDRDVQLYQQAAASIGDSTVPVETRQAALKTIRDLQLMYAERAKAPFQIFPNGTTAPDGWTTLPGGIRVRAKQ